MKGRIFELISKIINPKLSQNDSDYSSISEANKNINPKQQEYVQETLYKAYIDSSNAKISTIHSYCLDIIKSNADVAPTLKPPLKQTPKPSQSNTKPVRKMSLQY